ncbi:hypothetical protein HC891_04065 [Candidatus Gracilibacteria bacterium]|nr:hypothetical protein [Candidatus Gracilibacteria bacterium]
MASIFRPQVFTLMLTAFAMVIILGVGGMALLFGLAVVGARDSARNNMSNGFSYWGAPAELGRYYARTGSWEGVEQEFTLLDARRHDGDVLLLDASGTLVGLVARAHEPAACRCRQREFRTACRPIYARS